ncbi:hypothetical protein [uncultured Kordia sp.]|uniref:hypothetical protein n=1 Tax=uncultured Kordia sp. TaxID=507699 RepID=UPI0026194AF3|nr:hypothetical protein [uncultured Kordia sp.]
MKISNFIQANIRVWLNLTGRTIDFEKYPFLEGPIATSDTIGETFYQRLAEQEKLSVNHTNEGGLLQEFHKVIDTTSPHIEKLDPTITTFYEHTATYKMEVWNQWKAPISWFAKLLISLVSVEMKQLNIPTNALETSYGMSSDIIQLSDATNVKYACWLRKSVKSNKIVYAGFYSSVLLKENTHEYVKVVFPLPKGNVTVILKVLLLEDGSVKLVSDGKRFGGTGYYRLHQNKKGILKARMIPIKEIIHVFKDKEGVLRTDHFFKWWKFQFLQLHYKMTKKVM